MCRIYEKSTIILNDICRFRTNMCCSIHTRTFVRESLSQFRITIPSTFACATAWLLGRKVDDWSSCYLNESSIKNICHIMRQNIEHGHLEPWDAKWGNIWLSKLQQLVPSVAKQRSYDNTVGTLPNMFFPHLEDAKTFAQLVFIHFCIQLHILAGRFERIHNTDPGLMSSDVVWWIVFIWKVTGVHYFAV